MHEKSSLTWNENLSFCFDSWEKFNACNTNNRKKYHNLYFVYCKEKEIFWINNSKIHQRYFRTLFLAISKKPIAKMRMRKSLNEDGRKHNKNEEMSSVPFPFEFISAICSWKRTLRTWLLLNGRSLQVLITEFFMH